MCSVRATVAVALGILGAIVFAETVRAQSSPNSNPQQRDCQTVRTCEFRRGAPVRGCLSSYSCRTCTLTRVSCSFGGRSSCQEMRCNWGG
jgi:hypothetical protein